MIIVPGIISGLIAGYIASLLQKGRGSGCLLNLILGVVGGIFGSWLFSLFGLSTYSWIGETVVAIIGAVILLWIVAKLRN